MHRRHTKILGIFNRIKTLRSPKIREDNLERLDDGDWTCSHLSDLEGFTRNKNGLDVRITWLQILTTQRNKRISQHHPAPPCLCPVACTLHPWYSHDPSHFLRLHALVMMMMMMMMMMTMIMMMMTRRRRTKMMTPMTRIVLLWDDERVLNFMYVGHTIPECSPTAAVRSGTTC